ncbi:TonB-dependent receptor plug domain-containing protein [Celeribacter persicus]|uniref:Outer membrane receptor protein involved in Fe transport n=1 Tax=Celeribacter persicus TaxID=1651082 RepID=A0A2T5HVY9_9RHOB|nr:TonB-dependent receptor plug domain-containing protein [Celeribacter persicus]PTQ75725.1 outer membrane receptor protein involved in Fe transport [Celeribacter persicus]
MRFTSLFLRRRAVLLGTSALLLSAPATLLAQEPTVLDPILIEGEEGQTQALEGSDEGVGATALDTDAIIIRGDGSGDANTALTTLPHVQSDKVSRSDPGSNVDDVLDLQPQELSISGGSLTENTILLNGVSINSVTGTTNPLGADELNRETNSPNYMATFGLHSQTQFVPSSLIDSAEVLDNNISAQYGGFQGGVVKYELKKPSPDQAEGSFTLNYGTSDWANYEIGTKDGQNPDDQPKPTWTKLEYAYDFNQPVGDRSALRFGFSRRSAEGTKAKLPQYVENEVENESRSDFYSLSYSHEFLNGDTVTLSGQYTDYDQEWTSNYIENLDVDVIEKSLSLDAKFEKSWDLLSFAGIDLRDTKLTFRAIHQDNETSNNSNSDTLYYWYGSYAPNSSGSRPPFYTDTFDAWCNADDTGATSVACRIGGLGDKTYSDKQNQIEALFEGEVWNGNFALGANITEVKANRTASDFVFYSVANRLTDTSSFDAYTCAEDDPSCYDDIYMNRRLVYDAYDVDIDAFAASAFAELEQTWGTVTLRAGLRADYNDVLDNLDLAPRLSATWKPSDDFKLAVGVNRYYSDSYLAYAIHDGIPRGQVQTRTHNTSTGEVGDWVDSTNNRPYSFTQSNLDTPYTDEFSLTALFRENWTGGTWRLTGLYREGKDQFAASEDSGSVDQTLSNDGWSKYKSVSLEYENNWEVNRGALDSLGLYLSGIWADRRVSSDTYYAEDEGSLYFIAYNDESYSSAEFNEITGNLDIPVRATVELRSAWQNERLKLGLGADITAGYDGVRNTDTTKTLVNDTYGSQSHEVYEDYKFDAVVAAYLTATLRLAELNTGAVDLNLKVSNLFNDIGNTTATDDNPWIEGRSFYIGTSVTW